MGQYIVVDGVRVYKDELDQLRDDLLRQRNNLDNVIEQINSAVSGAVSAWEGPSAETFRERWMRNKAELEQLKDDLKQWSDHCDQQANAFAGYGGPFR